MTPRSYRTGVGGRPRAGHVVAPRAGIEPLALARGSLIAGSAVYGFSYLLSLHGLDGGFGDIFASMSLHPFRSGSPMEYRYLIPLLGWLTGLRGTAYPVLSIIGGAIFCVLAYAWAWRFYRSRSTALLLTLCLAFLSPVEFNHVAPGRSDIFCYVWLLGAMLWPAWAAVFVFLGLSTHEFFLIYVPWLYLYLFYFDREGSYGSARKRWHTLGGLAVACLAYALVRWNIAVLNEFSVKFSAGYYWTILRNNPAGELGSQPILLGLVVSLKAFWLLLLLAVVQVVRKGQHLAAALLFLPAASALALLLVALDTSRFLGHAFIFVLLLPRVLPGARSWLPIVFVVNVLIPSFYVGSDWYAPCNRFAQRFEPVLQAYFYRGTDYLPIWRR